MFKKVLVAEDLDSITLGLQNILQTLSVPQIEYAKYCDDAMLKIRRSVHDKDPFDLLITDLSFKTDHRTPILTSGEELIATVKQVLPEIKILAYSIEDKPYKIRSLFEQFKIDGYICKGRESAREFQNALDMLSEGATYISPQLSHALRDNEAMEIDQNDIAILKCLVNGMIQEEIAEKFKAEGRSGSSTSSIEKRINKLKIFFKAKTNAQLVSVAKDMGVI